MQKLLVAHAVLSAVLFYHVNITGSAEKKCISVSDKKTIVQVGVAASIVFGIYYFVLSKVTHENFQLNLFVSSVVLLLALSLDKVYTTVGPIIQRLSHTHDLYSSDKKCPTSLGVVIHAVVFGVLSVGTYLKISS